MNKIAKILVSVLMFVTFGLCAQVTPVYDGKQYWVSSTPVVPLDVLVKGRQAIVAELVKQVETVHVSYSGQSVVSRFGTEWYLDTFALQQRGYVHRGMFTELSQALSSVYFSGQVIQTPQGNYDVSVQISYMTGDNKLALSGWGWLNIQRQSDGTLRADPVKPSVYMNEVAAKVPGQVSAARAVGAIWGQGQDLDFDFDGVDTIIRIPQNVLENGFLALADQNGNVSAWDLKTGGHLQGKQLFVMLGQTVSGDIRSLVNPASLDWSDLQFFLENGYVFGRAPLTDLVTTIPMKEAIFFGVPVWGTKYTIAPSNIFITPIYVDQKGGSGTEGIETPLPWSDAAGAWILNIPAGGYHIRVEFDSVLDWNSDPWGKG